MSNDLARTQPLWIDTGPVRRFPQLEGDISVDVVVIGGGITGITAADLLKRAGKTVAVVELHRIGAGETGHTTAHLTEVLDTGYRTLIRDFGIEGAKLACQSNRKAIQRIEANISAYGIECGFQRVAGWKITENPNDIDALEEESDAALQLSVPNTLTYESPLPYRIERAIRFDHQAQFHPTKYVHAMASRLPGDGSHVFEMTRAIDFIDDEPCKVVTDRGTITADRVILATNAPLLNRGFLITKIAAYRTYSIAFRNSRRWDTRNLVWDTADPYHYVRSETIDGVEYLIVGGEDHKTGTEDHTEVHFNNLIEWCRQRFDLQTVDYRWSGQILNPVDGLPFIGSYGGSESMFVATGYMGNGMTFGTMAGMLLSDLITGNRNPWADLYDSTRVKPLAGAFSYLSENVDFPAHLIGDRLAPAQIDGLEALRENDGAIVRVGGKKVAAYRDPEGQMHLLSPVCPHMGCYVHWNGAEKSWDCPCHGSRFDPVGKLLNGPAATDLRSEMSDDNLTYATVKYETPAERPEPFGSPILGFFSCPLKPKPG